jgi:integrase
MEDARYFDGGKLVIFKRNSCYHARTRLGAKYVWRTLNTTDFREAEKKAWQLHHSLDTLQKAGLPVTAKSFAAVCDEYVAAREKEVARGKTKPAMLRQIKRVVKFWKEYAGTKPIHDVGDKELRDFVEWRRDYYTNNYVNRGKPLPHNAKLNPADKTLQWEIMLGKAIIKWAHEKGLRGNKPLPTFSFTPKVKRVRPAFELAEYRSLWRILWKRVQSCANPEWRATRELLRDYVFILANSGMRVGEANNLRIADVVPFTDDAGRPNFRLRVKGKTGEREVIPRAGAVKYFWRVLADRQAADPSEHVFLMPGGTPIITLADQFDAVLKDAGIMRNSRGEKYTLYSLRHFYAVMSLRRGVSVYTIAKNMGTSVQMIEAYYGRQATAPTFARALGD